MTTDPAHAQLLVRKLAAIMADVHRIPKSGRNEFHKYDYATEADIVEALRTKLAEKSIMLIPHLVESHVDKVGDKNLLTTVVLEFTFVDGDSGQSLTLRWEGTGIDSGDKGMYKAMTGALKYVLLKTFMIPTGDDPEAGRDDERPAPKGQPNRRPDPVPARRPAAAVAPAAEESPTAIITGEQLTRLSKAIKTHKTDVEVLKAWVFGAFKITSLAQLQRKDYTAVMKYVMEGVDVTTGEQVGGSPAGEARS